MKKKDIDILLFSLLFTPDVIEIGQTGKGDKQDFDIFFGELRGFYIFNFCKIILVWFRLCRVSCQLKTVGPGDVPA